MAVEATAYARAGLIGNPSDGYFGKTISFTMRNFAAKVSLYESPELEIIPSLQDRSKYNSLNDLVQDVKEQGYYGGIRLMKATVKRFADYCEQEGINLPKQNFSLRYRSNIPRRVGLAGSSALVTATLRCLMEFYDVDVPKHLQPNLILSVENQELGISAGLQDRVIQVYQGCVYMNFDRSLLVSRGYGEYEELDVDLLPPLFIAYRTDLAEGSEVFHNNIKQRWLEGDKDVVQAMLDFAGYAEEVRTHLLAGNKSKIGPLMDANFNRRMSIYKIDPANIDMVMRARNAGGHAKFAGSGGGIVGTYDTEETYQKIVKAFEGTRTIIFKPEIVS
jgi:glucuronokinase